MAVETVAPVAEEMPLVLAVEPQAPAWVQHTVRFLQIGELPEEHEGAERVTRRSALYQFVDNVLYRKRPNGVKLKCISREEGLELLAEIHGGICGSLIGSRALPGKAFRQGFFWPTALQDATTLVTKCEACQFHSKKLHQLAQALQIIPLVFELLCELLATSKPCTAIIAARFTPEALRKATLFFGRFNPPSNKLTPK